MKKMFAAFKYAAISSVVFLQYAGFALAAPAYSIGHESKIWLEGDSTLHEYTSKATDVVYTVTFEPDQKTETPLIDRIKKGEMKVLNVSIPVDRMRSGKSGLDSNMQKSLKAKDNPNITFQMQTYQVVASSVSPSEFTVIAGGKLEVAGVTKSVEIAADMLPAADGVALKGEKDLLMTDYGVKPPKILMIKTADKVEIKFDLRMTPVPAEH